MPNCIDSHAPNHLSSSSIASEYRWLLEAMVKSWSVFVTLQCRSAFISSLFRGIRVSLYCDEYKICVYRGTRFPWKSCSHHIDTGTVSSLRLSLIILSDRAKAGTFSEKTEREDLGCNGRRVMLVRKAGHE
jgi:hypothetical protein